MNKHTRRTVARLVSTYLRDCHPEGVSLEVDEAGIRKVNGQWRVPVIPSAEPVQPYQYYEALTDIEMELSEQEDLNVFLAPSDPKLAQEPETLRADEVSGSPTR
jgi:hypothetical protein